MTLQQLKYVDAIASSGSFRSASEKVFVTQPALTESIRTLEEELGISIFVRSSRGVSLTSEGEEFLSSARQILTDVTFLERKFTGKVHRLPKFSVSSHHYPFAVHAFMDVVNGNLADVYDFTFRETMTHEIYDDVIRGRSEIGVIYLSRRNAPELERLMKREKLRFEELFASLPYVVVHKSHPFAKAKIVSCDDLDDYPFVSFDKGPSTGLFFVEEVMPPISRTKNIRVTDRGTMYRVIAEMNGYTIASRGELTELKGTDMRPIHLDYDENIRIGLIYRNVDRLSDCGRSFVEAIKRRSAKFAAEG